MTDLTAGAQPAEVAATFQDEGLRGRLGSDDYRVRDQAQRELSAIYERNYPDAAEGPAPSQALGLPAEMLAPGALDVPADEFPPEASYIAPQAFKEAPELLGLFRSWCSSAELTQAEAIGVAAALDVFDREGADIGAWPEHLRQARLELVEQGFMATPEGRQTLARGRPCTRRSGGRTSAWPSCSTRPARRPIPASSGSWPSVGGRDMAVDVRPRRLPVGATCCGSGPSGTEGLGD
jgi:hypothetical protein